MPEGSAQQGPPRGTQAAGYIGDADLEQVFSRSVFTVEVDLNLGDGSDTVYTCDCSYEYVKINAEYMT